MMTTAMQALSSNGYVLGVDGCRTGWIAVALSLEGNAFQAKVYGSFVELLDQHAQACMIAVDTPIGLREDRESRACDREARSALQPRGSSVFSAPRRSLLAFCNRDSDVMCEYKRACDHSLKRYGKKISLQTFHLLPKIAELDALMTPKIQQRVIEVHPELSFFTANGASLVNKKQKAEGYAERCMILQQRIPGIAVPERKAVTRLYPGAQPDDLLDALIAAWSALRAHRSEATLIPEHAEHDPRGLRMQILI